MEDRNLASVVRVLAVGAIPGADNIEVATVKGWKVVIKRGEFAVGDLAIYYEIDSFLPVTERFEFLRARCFRKMAGGREGFRLKTVKLRGQVSQGLLMPIPVGHITDGAIEEGVDLTEELGIIKYELPIPAQLSGEAKGLFPNFVPKTDEERVQNYNSMGGVNLHGQNVYITEKLDGSSFTAYIRSGEFGICSRNLELKPSEGNAFWQAAVAMDLEVKFRAMGVDIALQGELIGPGVQGNRYGLKSRAVYFFTGYYIGEGRRMGVSELVRVLSELRLSMVPIMEWGYVLPSENLVEVMLGYAEGKSMLNPITEREGVVIRGLVENFSFKAISNRYLLKNE